MQSLGDALARVRGRPPNGQAFEVGVDDPDFIDSMLLNRPLWPASRIEDSLAQARATLAALGDDRATAGDVARLERELDLARWRDRLAAGRPDRCWCLGIGGYGRVAVAVDPVEGAVLGWRIYCSCPEAEHLKADIARRKCEIERVRAQAIIDRLHGSLPEGYVDWTLESLAALSPGHARLVARIEQWLPSDQWLFLYGPVGTGKTGAAVAAAEALAKLGHTTLFCDTADLLRRLRASFHDAASFAESGDRLWESLFSVQVLVLDDLGAEYHRHSGDAGTDWASEQIYNLLGTRHRERRRTLLTSNHSLDDLADILGHPRTTSRIQERSLVLDVSRLPNLRSKAEQV